MGDIAKTLEQMHREPAGVRFADLMRVCEHHFGPARQSGSSDAFRMNFVIRTP